MPATFNMSGYQGDTFRRVIRLRALNADGSNGDYINLTGWVPTMQIRAAIGSTGTPLADVTCTIDPDQVVNTGTVELLMSPAKTTSIPAGTYVYDLQFVEPNGDVVTRLKGQYIHEGEVTRA